MHISSLLPGLLIAVVAVNPTVKGLQCNEVEFMCHNQLKCISPFWKCDGDNDCGDWSDEKNCDGCKEDEFKCPDTARCIPFSSKCDGNNDCGDWSDEEDCNMCKREEVKCPYSGRCIQFGWRCDGENDCGDWSDEKECSCDGFKCNSGQCISPSTNVCDGIYDCDDSSDEENCEGCTNGNFMCPNTHRCIESAFICDGENDCGDWSDERECSCDGFNCTSGQCISSSHKICDGSYDCEDRSDEAICEECDIGEFMCPNTRICIYSGRRCNGINDCDDWSDEIDCPCLGFQCTSGQCIPSSNTTCDGINDCDDRSDEENCEGCITGDFKCSNTRCVHTALRCDGDNDCGDWSDEKGCPCDGFNCTSGQCISSSNITCDGINECDDRSDDANCDSCTEESFYCRNERKCISTYLRCNGENDCEDWSDEKHCNCDEDGNNLFMDLRIVGGDPADPQEWPFIAAIMSSTNNQFCGGSILTNRHILTAAHCLFLKPEEILVGVGKYNLANVTEPSQIMKVLEIVRHEGYNALSKANDIAILKLVDSITFNDNIKPVTLPPPIVDLTDRNAYAIGWGATYFGSPSGSNILRQVMVPIWSQERCDNVYLGNIYPGMMCAGYPEGGKDSCQGDSGGPLLMKLHCLSDWNVVGIVSTGFECARPGKPGVYTRVPEYLDWIFSNLN